MRLTWLSLPLGVLLGVFAQAETVAKTEDTISYCDLINDAIFYSGEIVNVRGTFKFTQDGYVLFEPRCRNYRSALLFTAEKSVQNPDVLVSYRKMTENNPYAEIRAVVRGRFGPADGYECIAINGGCYSYELKDVILLSVAKE